MPLRVFFGTLETSQFKNACWPEIYEFLYARTALLPPLTFSLYCLFSWVNSIAWDGKKHVLRLSWAIIVITLFYSKIYSLILTVLSFGEIIAAGVFSSKVGPLLLLICAVIVLFFLSDDLRADLRLRTTSDPTLSILPAGLIPLLTALTIAFFVLLSVFPNISYISFFCYYALISWAIYSFCSFSSSSLF